MYVRLHSFFFFFVFVFFFQAEDGIRDLVRSRGLGDVYKRQNPTLLPFSSLEPSPSPFESFPFESLVLCPIFLTS